MILNQGTLIALLFILIIGLIIPEVFKKFRLPFVTMIILAGSIFGPSGLNYVQSDDTIKFFGFLGMIFLILMGGLETDLTQLNKSRWKIIIMALLNGFIPFLVGVIITKSFGYSWIASILIGIVFISSSVTIIVSSLQDMKTDKKNTIQLMLAAVLVADIVSLIMLGVIFQSISPVTDLPLPQYFFILGCSIAFLFYMIPKISAYFITRKTASKDAYERPLRYVIIILIATLVFFSILGVHPILAAFLSGLALSPVIKKDKSGILSAKLHTLGYGMFIPIFLFIIGMDMNLMLFKEFNIKNVLMISLILGLILSKLLSGYLSGKIVGFSNKDSALFGSVSIIQFTTTLAVTYAAASLGVIDEILVTSIILLAIISTILGPLMVAYISRKKKLF